ncbi:MAG: DUF429 domain-containing protein [Rhodoferax sp.]|nr:DUF429 domain-containing protein [Rhodoferax sp.]
MVAYGAETMLIGCDFSSSPGKLKQIVIAHGQLLGSSVRLDRLERHQSLEEFARWLVQPGDWVGGFDLPFGLPRELVQYLDWPTDWEACMRHYAALTRPQIRALFAAFCYNRPVGGKFAHRSTDKPAGSSPSMKWVNPPVAYMLHAGVPLLLDAGVCLPGLHPGSRSDVDSNGRTRRVALEAYPGLLAREIVGFKSYKSDDRKKHTPQRLEQRHKLMDALVLGQTRLKLRLELDRAQRDLLCSDASGDGLDAVLCMMQAAWGMQQGWPWFGLPETMDPLEGWILSA